MQLGAGQGKTLVYLLTCLMLAKSEDTKDDYQKFGLVTTPGPLSTQLTEIVRKHGLKDLFHVFDFRTMHNLNSSAKECDFVIVDEAD